MLDDPARKLRTVAFVLLIVGLVLSIVAAFEVYEFVTTLEEERDNYQQTNYWEQKADTDGKAIVGALLLAVLTAIAGGVISYILALFVAGFARLIENTDLQREELYDIKQHMLQSSKSKE